MREFARFWVAGDVGDIELLHARYVSQRFVPHTHEGLTVGVILEGALAFDHQGSAHVAPSGTLSVVNPGEVHTGYAGTESGWTYRNFFVGPAVLRRITCELTGTERLPRFASPTLDDPVLVASLLRLHRTLETEPLRLERESQTLCGIAQLVLRHADERPVGRTPGNERAPVRRACDLIRDRFADDLSLNDLAAVAELSPYHFLRVFRQEVGLTPHAYLLQVRVERARERLDLGHPITRAALDCGFVDQSHLTGRFKQITGVTPGQYRCGRNFLQDRARRGPHLRPSVARNPQPRDGHERSTTKGTPPG